MTELTEIPLGGPEYFADPYPFYAQLREHHPICRHPMVKGVVVSRYADIDAILKDSRFSAGRLKPLFARLPEDLQYRFRPLFDALALWILLLDPPEHTSRRQLIAKAFTPRLIKAMRPRIRALVDELLDDAIARGHLDLIGDLAYPLPAIVIAEMMGALRADRDRIKRWSDDLAAFLGMPHLDVARVARAQESLVALTDYFRPLMQARREAVARGTYDPGSGDLMGELVMAQEAGAALSDETLLATCVMLVFAGHETTTHLIANGMRALLMHPAERDRLLARPELMESAVEEMLRFDSPIQRLSRTCTEDLEFRGHSIRKGERVFLLIGSANRDAAQFPEPDRFDVGRRDNRHLSFGSGMHYCVGAALGRLEAQVAFGALFDRLPGLALTGQPLSWQDNVGLRAMKELPLSFVHERHRV
ncbi:Cytochrome P450 [Sulfidibacter corallicola]|uniref:Cytochrome P450 n=1 Tax=Sulfidibacter corallicola TaxID=2818388 RepID=A0A8A4TLX4_SULCO|nr:cytochrome P450 [Sulfidibacter corallicola]QTD50467.1 cytochrome P450 [Sulfidibacter corallicola]